MWDLPSGKLRMRLPKPANYIHDACFSPGDRWLLMRVSLLSVASQQAMIVMDVKTGKTLDLTIPVLHVARFTSGDLDKVIVTPFFQTQNFVNLGLCLQQKVFGTAAAEDYSCALTGNSFVIASLVISACIGDRRCFVSVNRRI